MLFGIADLNVVAFGAEQDKVDGSTNASDIVAIKQLGLKGKVVFMKAEGDLVFDEFSNVKKYLSKEIKDEEEEEEDNAMEVEEEGANEEDADVGLEDLKESTDDSEDDVESGPEEESDEEQDEEEYEEEQFKANVFQSILAQTGPTVKAVLIKVSGKTTEKSLDMTPQADAVTKVLGGSATIVGQYKNGAVIMKLRKPDEDCDSNKVKLPAPFSEEKVDGPILLVRMDQSSEPQDFTIEDFTSLCEDGDAEMEVEEESESISASAAQSIADIARNLGSAHGAKIVEFYEKEIAAIENQSELKRVAEAIGQVHGKRIAQFMENDSKPGSGEVSAAMLVEDDLEEEEEDEDPDFNPEDVVASETGEEDVDDDEASTDDEKKPDDARLDGLSSTKKMTAVLVNEDGKDVSTSQHKPIHFIFRLY